MKRVVIEFIEGMFDGQCFDSSCENENGRAAAELYRFFGMVREGAKRQERTESLGEIIRRSSPSVLERAEVESWSEARRQAMMPYYNYAVMDWIEDETEVLIRAKYVGLDQ